MKMLQYLKCFFKFFSVFVDILKNGKISLTNLYYIRFQKYPFIMRYDGVNFPIVTSGTYIVVEYPLDAGELTESYTCFTNMEPYSVDLLRQVNHQAFLFSLICEGVAYSNGDFRIQFLVCIFRNFLCQLLIVSMRKNPWNPVFNIS